MGSVYNLVDWWEPYKASKAALNNTTQTNNIKQVVLKYTDKLQVRKKKDYKNNSKFKLLFLCTFLQRKFHELQFTKFSIVSFKS